MAAGGTIMRAFIFAASLLLAAGQTAVAADLYRPSRLRAPLPVETSPYLGWSGFYFGVNGGGAVAFVTSDFGILGTPAVASVKNPLTGAVGGAQIGFNWQTGVAVYGLEADIQASSVKGSLSAPCAAGLCAVPLAATYEQKVPWFGTVRGRLGVAWSGWLIYATGGYAYARIETDAFAAVPGAVAAFNAHDNRSGWTAGTGIEVAIAPAWSFKLEYLYLDFGRASTTLLFAALPAMVDDARFTMNVVRAGVNYRF
jgi:outer membrane immunogenic protein